MSTGVVYGVNSSMIVIGALKYFLGETKANGIEKGDTVGFEADANQFLTKLELLEKAGKAGTAPQQTEAPISSSPEIDERARKAGFGPSTTGPAAAAPATKPIKQQKPDAPPQNAMTVQHDMHVPAEVIARCEGPITNLDPEKLNLIKTTVARDCTNTEFELLLYLASKYHLDPLARQIWAVKYGTEPARIFTGRDGYLEIAHRSGKFDGMESGTKTDPEGKVLGWCKIYRKDMTHPFVVEVSLEEFNTHRNTWAKMPKIMIVKVAESQCLRKAFSISGIYSPEEFETETPGGA